MDTGKLLAVIDDIQSDEAKYGLQAQYQAILNALGQNDPALVNSSKATLEQNVGAGRLHSYVLTDFEVLEEIGIISYFSNRSLVTLDNILHSQSFEVTPQLTQFITERQAALDKINAIKSSLNAVQLEGHVLVNDEYEIGFSFPEKYQKVTEFERVLKDMRELLEDVARATGQETEFTISYVSNGTIEIFIKAGVKLATEFDKVLEVVLQVYESLQMAASIKNLYMKTFSKEAQDAVNLVNEAESAKHVQELIDKLCDELGITEPIDRNRVDKFLRRFLKHLEHGVSAEVRTPNIPAPESLATDATEEQKELFRETQGQLLAKAAIDARNVEIYKLQQTNFGGVVTALLPEGDEEETTAS